MECEYNKDLFDNLKITIQLLTGDFKSATETSWRSSMSDNDRMQRETLLFPIWARQITWQKDVDESDDIQSLQMTTLDFLVKLQLGILPC